MIPAEIPLTALAVGALVAAALLARLLRDTTRCECDLDPHNERGDTPADPHTVVIITVPPSAATMHVVIVPAPPPASTCEHRVR